MKNIVITGSARGIGHALVERALARGDRVFATVRKAADESKFSASPLLHVIEMDVSRSDSVARAFAEIDRRLAGERLDAVINSAAISYPGSIELTDVTEFENTLNTNALGSLRITKASIPRLRGHGGRLILLTSLWGHASGPMLTAYCMSKHAVESLADCARRETSGFGLHVILVEPGVVQTDMYWDQGTHVQALLARMSAEQKQRYEPLYARYRDLVGGAGGKGDTNAGISAEQCAIDVEQALFDPQPKPRYQSGEDAKQMIALVRQLSDLELDAVLGQRLNNLPLDATA